MKKILRLFLVALLCFAPLWYSTPAWAEDSEDFEAENEDGIMLWYHFLDDEYGDYVEVCGPNYNDGADFTELNIPSEVYWEDYYDEETDSYGKWYTVVGIGEEAFRDITNLYTVNFPETLTYIYDYAFYNCTFLNSIVLPKSMEYVGDYAFRLCGWVQDIVLNEGLQHIGEYAFETWFMEGTLTIPGTVTYFGTRCIVAPIATLIFGEGITRIEGEEPFEELTYLKEVSFPSTLTYLGYHSMFIPTPTTRMEKFTCYAVEPPECDTQAFEGETFGSATLYVPAGTLEKYSSDKFWGSLCSTIVEMDSEEDNTFTISSAGYATYYTDVEYVMPAGVTGTTVTGVANTTSGDAEYVLTMPWEYGAGSKVPAKTALVLQGEANTYEYETSSTGAEAPTDNLLVGSTTDTTTTGPNGEEEGYVFYELSDGQNGVGFYYGATDGAAFTSAANKAWLPLSEAQVTNARFLGFGKGDDTTGISSIESASENTVSGIYTIQGVRVSNTNQPGLYIVDGKKVLVK